MGLIRKSVKPILTRYYLWSSKWFGIKLHRIKQSDAEWHTHPWWGFSIIFGMYREQYEDDHGIRRRFLFNIISPWRAHRVITSRPVWTLFFHGPRVNENWRYGDQPAPWRGPDSEIKGVFISADSPQATALITTYEFVPCFTIRNGDGYTIEGDNYTVRDANGNILQTGKVILKS